MLAMDLLLSVSPLSMARFTAEARKEPSAALDKLGTCPIPCHQSPFFHRLLLTLLPNRINKIVCLSVSISRQISILRHSRATNICRQKIKKPGHLSVKPGFERALPLRDLNTGPSD